MGGPARRYGRQQRDIQFPDSMETWESIQQRKLSGHLLAYFNSQNRKYRQASSEELSTESSEEILFSANTEDLEARGCGDKSYCEDSTLYPESYVVNLLETNSKIPPGIVNKFIKEGFKNFFKKSLTYFIKNSIWIFSNFFVINNSFILVLKFSLLNFSKHVLIKQILFKSDSLT